MSKEKKLPPIQPAPVRPFTVRLVDGHFVRVPKLDQTAQTDATRPATRPAPGSPPIAGSVPGRAKPPRTMRLVNGRFVRSDEQTTGDAAEVKPTADLAPALPLRTSAPKPRPKNSAPTSDSWAATFGTEIDPADLPSDRSHAHDD